MSALPVLEQKAAIPLALSFDMNWIEAFIYTWVGALVPAPFILLFVPKVIEWMRRFEHLKKIADWYEHSAMKRGKNIVKYELLGLFAFVAFPLPMTGVWTGSFVAALLKLDFRKSLLTIMAGAVVCGCIIMLVAQGVLTFTLGGK